VTYLPPAIGDDDRALLEVLHATADAVSTALAAVTDWGPSGLRDGQYAADLAADDAALGVLRAAGLGVLSEETGRHAGSSATDLVAIVDPLDGSTNASHGVPWFATAVCVVDGEGPRVALVANQATLVGGGHGRYVAVRGAGAWFDDGVHEPTRLAASGVTTLADALVGLSGLPPQHLGWRQYRALGASALDLCLVASGTLDAFIDCSFDAHGVWDYAAGTLICREAGAVVADALGRDLIVLDPGARRTPVGAATDQLLAAALRARRWDQ
jgi:fructose-1,6-bisphosphatase/inositol monophosphatase family enzyme